MAFTVAQDGPVHSREASERTANHVMRRPPMYAYGIVQPRRRNSGHSRSNVSGCSK